MNKEDKLKEYYKNYQKSHRSKYSEYSRNYYHQNKEKFKKYYETYKKNKLAKANGTYEKQEKPKKTKRELERLRWERKMQKNEEKRLAFIEYLTAAGHLPYKQSTQDQLQNKIETI